jgi:KDO2-lipid IV(A) lauroyltransferase
MIFYRALSWLPFPLLYALAWIGYILLYYAIGYRKAVVGKNLEMAFPDKSAREITYLAKKFYRQLAETSLEIIKARRMSKEDFRERVTVINPELLRDYSNNYTESVIITSIHQANWEWMLHGVNCATSVPMDPVYKPLHDKVTDKLIFDIRRQFGSRPLSMKESTRDILRRRREFRLFVMIGDQSPTRKERSYWTSFMNRDAAFYLGAEIIAKTTKFPLLFAQCRRSKRGHYEVTFHEIGKPPHNKEGHQLTDRYVELAEMAIRAQPDSWLWSNRRWKRLREEEEVNT